MEKVKIELTKVELNYIYDLVLHHELHLSVTKPKNEPIYRVNNAVEAKLKEALNNGDENKNS